MYWPPSYWEYKKGQYIGLHYIQLKIVGTHSLYLLTVTWNPCIRVTVNLLLIDYTNLHRFAPVPVVPLKNKANCYILT